MTSNHVDTAIRWARTTRAPVTLAEAQVRLIHSDPRLASAVVESQRKRRRGACDEVLPPGARSHAWQHWGVRRRALWVVLLLLPLVAVLYVPNRRVRSPESAELFFDVTFGTYLAAAVLQAVLLVVWLVRPLMWGPTRVLSAWLTLAMVFVLPPLLLTVGTLRGSEGWWQHAIPVPIATLLAAANLWATLSDRTRRLGEARDLAWFQTLLEGPEPVGEEGPRSPARELRRTIRRLPDSAQQDLERHCGRVLEILAERDLICGADAERASATPLGRWHDLDRVPDRCGHASGPPG